MVSWLKTKKKAAPAASVGAGKVSGSKAEKPKENPKKTVVKVGLFSDDAPSERSLPHPDQELRRHKRLAARINAQSIILVVLILTYLAAVPFFMPTQLYFIRRVGQPLGAEQRIRGLHLPILTQAAILSWSSTTVTEVMTFNFADYNQRLSSFGDRFLPESWAKFVDALLKEDTINKFKSFNLVMTAAPSAPAIIAEEGPDEETGEYQWKVQVPVILNYVTNNNRRTKNNHVINLTLVRVSTLESPHGIAIKIWQAR